MITNDEIKAAVNLVKSSGNGLLMSANELEKSGVRLVAMIAACERGYIKKWGTVDIISYEQRRFAYTLGQKCLHAYRYDHFRAGMLCDTCDDFISDFL